METGKRRVPLEYNNALSKILEVSLAYLQGLTDDPLSEVADENVYTPDSLTKEKFLMIDYSDMISSLCLLNSRI